MQISLTEFVDFVTKAGQPKITAVRMAWLRHQENYDPRRDFYKRIREGIVQHHQQGKPISALDALATGQTDKKKRSAYPLIVQGYRRFLGRKDVAWMDPPREKWAYRGLEVAVNPELGLLIDQQPHLVKMYWKKEPVRKPAVPAVLHLLQIALPSPGRAQTLGLLDVRRGHLITADDFDPQLTPLLEGEALSFARIYRWLSHAVRAPGRRGR